MKVIHNSFTNEYEIYVNADDLLTAFISHDNLQQFLHDIVKNTFDENMADYLFPIKKGDNDEDV